MSHEILEQAVVKNGGTITVTNKALPEGAVVQVRITYGSGQDEPKFSDYFEAGHCFSSVDEIDMFLNRERDGWRV